MSMILHCFYSLIFTNASKMQLSLMVFYEEYYFVFVFFFFFKCFAMDRFVITAISFKLYLKNCPDDQSHSYCFVMAACNSI